MSSKYDNIAGYVEELGAITAEIKALTERKKFLEESVRPVLMDEGEKLFGDYAVVVKSAVGRKSLDKKAVEAAGIDLTPYYTQGKPFTTLSIKKLDRA